MRRGLAWAAWLGALSLSVVLLARGGGGALAPPPVSPGGWGVWAAARTPVEASAAALRLGALVAAGYLFAVTAMGVGAALLRRRAVVTVAQWSPPALRWLLGAWLAGTLATGPAAAASTTSPPPTMVLLPDDGHGPTKTTATPKVLGTPPPPAQAAAPPPAVTTTLSPGDHLWSVAARTLATAWGRPPTEREVAPYWRLLVELNRTSLPNPADPDLVFPGDVVRLPPVRARGRRPAPYRRCAADQRRPRGLGVILWSLVALTIADQLHLLLAVTRDIVTVDQATHWYAAREWGELRPHQLHFYGQSYGSGLEAGPLELLRRFGIPLPTATPVLWSLLASAGWFILAFVAWRRGKPVLAAAALACPLVLSAYYGTFVHTLGASIPRLCAFCGVAILLSLPRRAWVETAAFSLLGVAVVFDGAVVLLAAPVAAWYFLASRDQRRVLATTAAGAVVPAAIVVWSSWFYRRHPDYNLHGGNPTNPSLRLLHRHLGELDRFFDLLRPELVPSWIVPVLVLVGLVGIAVATRRLRFVVPALAVPALVVLAIALPKSEYEAGRFLPLGRVLIMLPPTVWFLSFVVSDAFPAWRRVTATTGVVVVALLAAASVGVRAVGHDSRVLSLRDAALSADPGDIGFQRTSTLEARCASLQRLAPRAGATLVVFLQDGLAAYGCGALLHGRVETLLPGYERRTWVLYEELHRRRQAMLVADVFPDFCSYAEPHVAGCERHGNVAVVTFQPQSALRELLALGVPLRPFGPRCRPQKEFDVLTGCAHPVDIGREAA